MTDALVAAIAAGDTDAFAQWMRGAERPLRLSLRRYAAVVDTEAVLQETLLRVWQVAPRFKPDGKPDGLLRLAYRIAHNLAVSEIRARNSEQTATDTLDNEHEEAAIESASDPDPMLERAIKVCFELLSEKPRQAMMLRLTGAGLSDVHLAEILEMTRNTFLQNITRARKALIECLERHDIHLDEVSR